MAPGRRPPWRRLCPHCHPELPPRVPSPLSLRRRPRSSFRPRRAVGDLLRRGHCALKRIPRRVASEEMFRLFRTRRAKMALPCPRVLTKKAAVRACPRSQMTARTRASSRWRSTPTPLRDRLLSPENEYLTPTTHHLPNRRRRETTLLVGRLRNRTETFCARIGHLLQDPSPQSAKAVMPRSSLAKRREVRTSHIKRRDDRRSASRLDRTPRCRRLLRLWEALNKKGRSARRCRRLTPAPTR